MEELLLKNRLAGLHAGHFNVTDDSLTTLLSLMLMVPLSLPDCTQAARAARPLRTISRRLGRSFSPLNWPREWRVGLVMGRAW